MSERIVSDSTCLIALERIGNVEFLPALFGSIIIPPVVQWEFGITMPWLTVTQLSDPSLAANLKMIVDDGEAEAIALAREHNCRIITDDRRARSVARQYGLDIVGTVGVLVLAKQKGIVSSIRPLLTNLEINGFYFSTALKEEALGLARE